MALTMPQKLTAKLLFFVSYILYPKYPTYFFVSYMYFVHVELRKLKLYFDVIPCPNELIQHYIDFYSESALDINNTVIISQKTAQKLKKNCFNLAFINSQADKNDFRIVHTLSIPDIIDKDMLMSENLYHNINRTKNMNKMRITSINTKYIKIAKEAEVALISSQNEINNAFIDILLKNYFQTPRLLYKHDVFSINVQIYAPELVCSSFQLLNIKELYFKCKKVSSEQVSDSVSGLFCVNGETTLIQNTNVRCYLPLSIFKLCINDTLVLNLKYEDYLISKCPYGLEKYLKEIEKAVMLFISKSK